MCELQPRDVIISVLYIILRGKLEMASPGPNSRDIEMNDYNDESRDKDPESLKPVARGYSWYRTWTGQVCSPKPLSRSLLILSRQIVPVYIMEPQVSLVLHRIGLCNGSSIVCLPHLFFKSGCREWLILMRPRVSKIETSCRLSTSSDDHFVRIRSPVYALHIG